ncbi:MAG: hypothetical protein ACO2OO_03365 [Candidatus Aenigmatarchaeota archaeon]
MAIVSKHISLAVAAKGVALKKTPKKIIARISDNTIKIIITSQLIEISTEDFTLSTLS